LESMVRNTQKSFAKFGGLLSSNDQEIAERVLKEAEVASSAESREPIDKALTALERVAGQLTNAMMNPSQESSTKSVETPPSDFTKF
jgi:hypothetical protein